MKNHPIGILDSGIGGLTVLKEIQQELPEESIIYIGDSRNIPYGKRQREEIYHLACRMIDFLLQQKVKTIVIACNTITVSCIAQLRETYPDIPLIGTVPVIKKAVEQSKTKRIGVLSTTLTAKSVYQNELIEKFAQGYFVSNHGTDELVPLIEKGIISGSNIEKVLHNYVLLFQKENIDVLVLGCTHFPFIHKLLEKMLGKHIKLLNSGTAIAHQVRRILTHNGLLVTQRNLPDAFYTTGNKTHMSQIGENYIGIKMSIKMVTL
ncbi:MAG: glutamate racemase [Candidatus Levyibacteriota bacterium]